MCRPTVGPDVGRYLPTLGGLGNGRRLPSAPDGGAGVLDSKRHKLRAIPFTLLSTRLMASATATYFASREVIRPSTEASRPSILPSRVSIAPRRVSMLLARAEP